MGSEVPYLFQVSKGDLVTYLSRHNVRQTSDSTIPDHSVSQLDVFETFQIDVENTYLHALDVGESIFRCSQV